MLTPAAMLTLAADLTNAEAHGDAQSLAAIAWQLYGEAGEHLAEIAAARRRPRRVEPPPGNRATRRSLDRTSRRPAPRR